MVYLETFDRLDSILYELQSLRLKITHVNVCLLKHYFVIDIKLPYCDFDLEELYDIKNEKRWIRCIYIDYIKDIGLLLKFFIYYFSSPEERISYLQQNESVEDEYNR